MNEPQISFEHAKLKVEWSNELINNLKTAITQEINSAPKRASMKLQGEGEAYTLSVGNSEKGLPAEFFLLAGDIVSNLRASLDYCWMGLVRSAEGVNTSEKKTLPIADNRKGLVSMIDKAPIGGTLSKAKPLIIDTIKSHRDFAAGGNRPLIALNELCNWNKHNRLIIQTRRTILKNVQINENISIGSVQSDGDIKGAIAVGGPNRPNVSHEGDAAIEIILGAHELVENESLIPTLLNFSKVASETIEAFCETFR